MAAEEKGREEGKREEGERRREEEDGTRRRGRPMIVEGERSEGGR
jgi:hypothetical protein